ncbi:MAG: hypothetical protein HOL65_05015 [Microbacteriaceae bacterium]|nr:hypothetical protein [Microbacteriaceae bacterium]
MPQFSLPNVLVIGAIIVAGGVGVGVASVSAMESADACEIPVAEGKASALVSADLSDPASPQVSFPTPLVTAGAELSVLSPGEGEPARVGGAVDFDVSVFVGSDGQYLTGSGYDPLNPVRRLVVDTDEEFFGTILACQKPGAQVIVTAPIVDVFGPIEGDDYVNDDSTVVLVIDVHNTYLASANGSSRLPQSGMPTVVQAPTGEHGLSFPNAPIPDELRISVLKQGSGDRVEQGDVVVTHYTSAVWNTREVFSSSFERGIPLSLMVEDLYTSTSGSGIIPGLVQALVGQNVGSQVLVSVPPQLGYAPGGAPAGVPDGATLVYVLDIVGVSN